MTDEDNKNTIRHDLHILRVERGVSNIGAWVIGTVSGHYFNAKMFPEHAMNPNWEIGRSRISKLELRRRQDDRVVFNWDRGEEKLEKDPLAKERVTKAIVDYLADGALAKFGHSEKQDRREMVKVNKLSRAKGPEFDYDR